MAKKRSLTIPFPLAGLNRRAAYRQQPPYSSPNLLNVRAVATLEGRERGGSRPGLVKSHVDDLGGPIRLLSPMVLAMGDSFTSFSDNFAGASLAAAWTQASWADDVPLILPYSVASVDTTIAEGEVVLDVLPIDTSETYTVEMFIVPWNGEWHGKYRLYARLDNDNPNIIDNGVVLELVATGNTGVYSGTLKIYINGDRVTFDITPGVIPVRPGWLSMSINNTAWITVYFNGEEILSGVQSGGHSGHRVGFGMECTVDGGFCLCNTFRVQYYSTGEVPAIRSVLVASAVGDLFVETTYGRMTEIPLVLTLQDDTPLQACQSGQDLYIADYGDLRITQTDGIVTGDQLTATANPVWDALGILTYDDVVVISNVGGATVAGTYKITSAAPGALTLASSPGNGTCAFRIERAPKVFDPSASTLVQMTASTGQVPTGCPLICRYLDRIILAGAEIAPHVWYMSRQSVPLDWDYSQEDAQRAVAGTASAAGVPGDPIVALIPHSDDYLVIACRNSLWRLLGDPAYEGSLNAISHTVGVVGPSAWCLGPAGELIFLSLDGLYALPPGGTAYPIALSREVLPREFLNLNPDMLTVLLEYDLQGGGVHIYLTQVSSNARIHWWFDWARKTFWPVSLYSYHEPTATCAIQATVIEDSGVILGGRDGKLRRLCDLAENDCGVTYETYVVIGPVPLAKDSEVGILCEIDAVMADGSGPVIWEVVSSLTFEGAISGSVSDTGTWTEGLNATSRPACRGQAFSLKITGTAGRKWAVETLTTSAKPAGKRRLA